MKMRELVKQTGVSRESIHYYTREGMLPEVKKPSPNQAIYTEKHVERILFIKKLQEKHYLPIPLIKKILDWQADSPFDENLLDIKSDYFMTADHFLPLQIEGAAAFLDFTGISADRLADFEAYGIITPDGEPNQKVYPHDSIKIGKLIGDMRKRGLSYEKGFPRAALKEVRDMLMPIMDYYEQCFVEGVENASFSDKEMKGLELTALELIPLFMYYMSRILLEKAMSDRLEENEEK
ncbi:MAG: MerR family transcriptional regulator [Thermodesulfobacteriota bacterium]